MTNRPLYDTYCWLSFFHTLVLKEITFVLQDIFIVKSSEFACVTTEIHLELPSQNKFSWNMFKRKGISQASGTQVPLKYIFPYLHLDWLPFSDNVVHSVLSDPSIYCLKKKSLKGYLRKDEYRSRKH